MLRHLAAAVALLAALPFQARAETAARQPGHLIINVTCGGFELWYQDGAVWGSHDSCGGPAVTEAGLVAKMGGTKYLIVTTTYPVSGIMVTTRFTMPVDGQGEWDSYTTDGSSAPTRDHGTYTTS